MRVVFGALSFAAGVVLFFLFAKLLVAGLFFALGLAVFAFFMRKLKRVRYGRWHQHRFGTEHAHTGYSYPAVQAFPELTEDGLYKYRTIRVL
ncbi:MAG: hypothetical protein AAFZ63_06155 [Bacteroidota bacterium]